MKPDPSSNSAHAQTVRFYNAEAEVYDASRYASSGGQRVDAFHKQVLERLLFRELPSEAHILELGCGTGRLLAHFSQRFPGLRGIDSSTGMLEVAARRCPGVNLQQGSAYDLPFADSTFSAVYAVLVINLLQDYQRVFAQVARVLVPGGRFVFNVPNLRSIYWPGGAWVNFRGRTTGSNTAGSRYSHWFTLPEVDAALSSNGLDRVDVVGQPALLTAGVTRGPFPGQLPWSLLCKSLYVVARRRP